MASIGPKFAHSSTMKLSLLAPAPRSIASCMRVFSHIRIRGEWLFMYLAGSTR